MKKWTPLMLSRSGIIAALYVALTFVCFSVASGNIQFRISEMLTIMSLFYVEAIPALFIGCLLSNILTGCAIWDIILGSLVTALSAFLTYLVGRFINNPFMKVFLGGLSPTVLNAFLLPLIWFFAYGTMEIFYWLNVLYLFISEGTIIWIFGGVLYVVIASLIKKNLSFMLPVSSLKQKH